MLREKVIEHVFIAELSKTLLLEMGLPFEILRAEFDANGYDLAIEAGGLLRHVQLKAMREAGKRAHVDVQLSLADKPSGCVVWIVADPKTLSLGPFYWFGGEGGEPMPSLGEREAKHTKPDTTGHKKARPRHRRLTKGMFTRIETMRDLALVMVPPMEHRQLLERHLARNLDLPNLSGLAKGIRWETSAPLAYLIDGYALAAAAGVDDPYAFADRMRENAERTGHWNGSALELWLALFMEHRRDHFSGAIGASVEVEPAPLLDDLCKALSDALAEHGRG